MSVPALIFRVVAGGLLLVSTGVAEAGEILDRRYIALPPVYAAPPPGFVPLPASGAPQIFRNPGAPSDRPVWNPARTEVVVGVDGKGRITHALEYTPGRFAR